MSETGFNPLEAEIAEATSGAVPPGTYTAEFVGATYLPVEEADAMTGKGGRKFAQVGWSWTIRGGEHDDRTVNRDTPANTKPGTQYYDVASWLLGKGPTPGQSVGLTPYIGKKYLITMGAKPGKTWVEVVNAMRLPETTG